MRLTPTERVREYLNAAKESYRFLEGGWGVAMIPLMDVHSVEALPNGHYKVTFTLVTQKWMANSRNTVHGGCTMTMVDNFSSWAISAEDEFWTEELPDDPEERRDAIYKVVANVSVSMGVSRTLNASYLLGIPLNEQIFVECETSTITKRFLHSTVRFKDTRGRTLVSGYHDRVRIPLKPEPKM